MQCSSWEQIHPEALPIPARKGTSAERAHQQPFSQSFTTNQCGLRPLPGWQSASSIQHGDVMMQGMYLPLAGYT